MIWHKMSFRQAAWQHVKVMFLLQKTAHTQQQIDTIWSDDRGFFKQTYQISKEKHTRLVKIGQPTRPLTLCTLRSLSFSFVKLLQTSHVVIIMEFHWRQKQKSFENWKTIQKCKMAATQWSAKSHIYPYFQRHATLPIKLLLLTIFMYYCNYVSWRNLVKHTEIGSDLILYIFKIQFFILDKKLRVSWPVCTFWSSVTLNDFWIVSLTPNSGMMYLLLL